MLFTVQSSARAYIVADSQILMFLKPRWNYIAFCFSVHQFYFQWSFFSFFFVLLLLSSFPFWLLQCFVSYLICKNFIYIYVCIYIYIYLKCAILLLLSEVCPPVFCHNYFSVKLQCQQLLPHSCQLKHKCYRLLFLEKQVKM